MTYDVATDTAEGRHHLQRVAKACQAFGERVQKSVFECTLRQAQLTQVASRLGLEVDVTIACASIASVNHGSTIWR